MITRVIHIRDSQKNESEAYIGRAGKGHSGLFGNPIAIGKLCPLCHETHNDRGSTLSCYEQYLLNRLSSDEAFFNAFWQLKGKTLVCFCKPQPCHGDVMAKILDG